ncbi:uncharacterized protein STEHIDRAFT_155556 [Stereum hirsutum FP-91666 SS1]|uniref:uncharacterized protein n=1 Tax=Stereum hirsutum (strain FP-91666) TaxID=721885 RepID=UPI000440AE67|nr:uncharacterized protein STEHIDRAFT_155556 [Stereum hirsutum FP-91666 SS1]EIM88200.1 hypothetical protein STEHIDRAFT_155556 [Stereum hirsutum FP-91666 SS1]
MSGLSNAFYNAFVKRNSVYVSTIFVGAFAFGVGFDVGVTKLWDTWNKGVRPPLHLSTPPPPSATPSPPTTTLSLPRTSGT